MSTSLLLIIGGLAVLDMLSPTALGVTVYLLLADKRNAFSRLSVYLFTVGTIYFTAGLFLMLGLGYLADTLTGIFRNQLMSWLAFLIGLLLFIGSFYVPKRRRATHSVPKSKGPMPMIGLGISTALLEISMAVPYFASIGLMTTAELPLMQWLPILVSYNVLMLLPPIVLYLLYLLFARWMRRPLEALRRKIASSSDSALSWVMCIVGLILILNTADFL